MRKTWQALAASWWVSLCIIGIGVAVYANSLSVPFIFDDILIKENLHLRHFWAPWNMGLGTARPLTYYSWALNYAVGGLNPWGYHVVNIAIHVGAALLLYGLIRRTLLLPQCAGWVREAASWLALSSALLWMVHPIQTESVTYLYQRAESLMGLFYLATGYCVLRGASSTRASRWYTAAIVMCALGMATKPVMVTAPLLVLFYDRVFLSGSWRGAWRSRRDLYLGFAATWGLLAWLLIAGAAEYNLSAGYVYEGFIPVMYTRSQPGVLLHYLRLVVWPHPLVLDYFWPVATGVREVLCPALAIGGILLALWLAFRRVPATAFLGWSFFLILAPTSTVIPICDLAVEHRMYLALAPVIILLVLGGCRCVRTIIPFPRWRASVAVGLLMAGMAALGALTIRRNNDYRSEWAIWQDTLAKRPLNPRAHFAIGLLLGDQGKLDEAIPYFERTYRLKPDYQMGHFNLAVALSRDGRYQEAFARYQELLRLRPDDAFMHYSYGLSLAHAGLFEEAGGQFTRALELNPQYAEVHYNLGVVFLALNTPQEAVAHFAYVLLLQGSAQRRDEISATLARLGMLEEVRHYLTRLLDEHASK